MADKATYSALQKRLVSIPPFSVVTVDYIDTQPNYFRVQNNGEGSLYCSTAHIPTRTQYDFIVKSAGMKMFAEPFYRAKLYIYNPTGTEINAVVLSFRAEFDPLALALSDLEISMPDEVESTSVITGFQASLPTGSNLIGKVEVENQKDYQSTLDVIKGNQRDYSSALANILAAVGNIGTPEFTGNVEVATSWESEDVSTLLGRMYNLEAVHGYKMQSVNETATVAGYTVTPSAKIKKIIAASNDGESDMTMTVTNEAGNTCDIILKAGEVLNDVYGSFTKVIFTGDNVPFRFIISTIS